MAKQEKKRLEKKSVDIQVDWASDFSRYNKPIQDIAPNLKPHKARN